MYVARVQNGFVPASRRQVFEKIRPLASPTMPFANLPDTHKSRWRDEPTAEKMRLASPNLSRIHYHPAWYNRRPCECTTIRFCSSPRSDLIFSRCRTRKGLEVFCRTHVSF